MKKGPDEVTGSSYRTENMYQMCVAARPPPLLMRPSVHAKGGEDNVYCAQPRADYSLCSVVVRVKCRSKFRTDMVEQSFSGTSYCGCSDSGMCLAELEPAKA